MKKNIKSILLATSALSLSIAPHHARATCATDPILSSCSLGEALTTAIGSNADDGVIISDGSTIILQDGANIDTTLDGGSNGSGTLITDGTGSDSASITADVGGSDALQHILINSNDTVNLSAQVNLSENVGLASGALLNVTAGGDVVAAIDGSGVVHFDGDAFELNDVVDGVSVTVTNGSLFTNGYHLGAPNNSGAVDNATVSTAGILTIGDGSGESSISAFVNNFIVNQDGVLHVRGTDDVTAVNTDSDGNVFVYNTGSVSVTDSAEVNIKAGNNAEASAFSGSSINADANAFMEIDGGLTIDGGALNIEGGDSGYAHAKTNGSKYAFVSATAELVVNDITISTTQGPTEINVTAGNGGVDALASANTNANAYGDVSASVEFNDFTASGSAHISVTAGSNIRALVGAFESGTNQHGGNAEAVADAYLGSVEPGSHAGNDVTLDGAGGILVKGGDSAGVVIAETGTGHTQSREPLSFASVSAQAELNHIEDLTVTGPAASVEIIAGHDGSVNITNSGAVSHSGPGSKVQEGDGSAHVDAIAEFETITLIDGADLLIQAGNDAVIDINNQANATLNFNSSAPGAAALVGVYGEFDGNAYADVGSAISVTDATILVQAGANAHANAVNAGHVTTVGSGASVVGVAHALSEAAIDVNSEIDTQNIMANGNASVIIQGGNDAQAVGVNTGEYSESLSGGASVEGFIGVVSFVDANAEINISSEMTLSDSASLNVLAGNNIIASGSGADIDGYALVLVGASGNAQLNDNEVGALNVSGSGQVNILGGNNVTAQTTDGALAQADGSASVELNTLAVKTGETGAVNVALDIAAGSSVTATVTGDGWAFAEADALLDVADGDDDDDDAIILTDTGSLTVRAGNNAALTINATGDGMEYENLSPFPLSFGTVKADAEINGIEHLNIDGSNTSFNVLSANNMSAHVTNADSISYIGSQAQQQYVWGSVDGEAIADIDSVTIAGGAISQIEAGNAARVTSVNNGNVTLAANSYNPETIIWVESTVDGEARVDTENLWVEDSAIQVLGGNDAQVNVTNNGHVTVNASGSSVQGGAMAVADGEADVDTRLTADNIMLDNASILVQAGSGARATVINNGNATVNLDGSGAQGSADAFAGGEVDVESELVASTAIALHDGASITVQGGDDARAIAENNGIFNVSVADGATTNNGDGSTEVNAYIDGAAEISVGSSITLNSSATLNIFAGDDAFASADGANATAITDGTAIVTAGGNTVTVNAGATINVKGGNDAEASSQNDGSAAVLAYAELNAGSELDVDGGTVNVVGGNNQGNNADARALVYAGDVTVRDGGTISMADGAAGSEHDGASAVMSVTTLDIQDSTSAVNVYDGAEVNASSTINNAGTLRIGGNVTTDSYQGDGRLEFVINGTEAGLLTIEDSAYDRGASVIGLSEVSLTGLSESPIIRIIDSVGSVGMVATEISQDNEDIYLFDFLVADGGQAEVTDHLNGTDDSDVYVIAYDSNRLEEELADGSIDQNSGNVLEVIREITTSDITDAEERAYFEALQTVTGEDVEAIAESLVSTGLNGDALQGAIDAAAGGIDITNERIDEARAKQERGIAAGEDMSGSDIWGKVFGRIIEQDEREGIKGYEANTYGITVGVDSQNQHGHSIGLAFSYANTDVDGDDVNGSEAEIDTYQLALYGNYRINEKSYLSGILGYSLGNNETVEHRLLGGDVHGEFDSNQMTIQLETGRVYAVNDGLSLTPSLLGNYVYYDSDSYTQTGGTGAKNIDNSSLTVLEFGVGLDADWHIEQEDGATLTPNLNVGYRYDVIGDEIETNSSFVAGGGSFRAEGYDPAQSSFHLGTGLGYESNSWALSLEYDFEVKSDYRAHGGSLRASYKF